MSRHVLVLPSAAQLAAADAVARYTGHHFEAIVDPELADHPAAAVRLVPAEVAAARSDPSGWVMCGHERGVYWMAEHRAAVGSPNFGEACLRMLTKLELGAALGRACVRATPKRRLTDWDRDGPAAWPFPLVLKPNFGFASTLVRRVEDQAGLDRYRRDFDGLRRRSPIVEYERFAEAFVPDPWELVVEPDLSRRTRFLTVPFLVAQGGLRAAFPVQGDSVREDEQTDFHWSGFSIGSEPAGVHDPLHRALTRLVDAFDPPGGVYEIEALYEDSTGVLHVLEFSPRATGGMIPELVRFATGVDLHRYGLLYFLGLDEPLPADGPPRRLSLTRRPVDESAEGNTADPPLASWTRRVPGTLQVEEIRPSGSGRGVGRDGG